MVVREALALGSAVGGALVGVAAADRVAVGDAVGDSVDTDGSGVAVDVRAAVAPTPGVAVAPGSDVCVMSAVVVGVPPPAGVADGVAATTCRAQAPSGQSPPSMQA